MPQDEVLVYALSTCPWCRKTKQWFADSNVPFEFVDVDTLPADEQDAAAEKAYQLSGGRRFPVVVINGEPFGSGVGRSKKAAETDAAAQAWTALDAMPDEPQAGAAELDA